MNGISVSWPVIAPVLGLQLILLIAALITCFRAEKTNGPKWMWVLIIVVVGVLGPVAFFVAGRREE